MQAVIRLKSGQFGWDYEIVSGRKSLLIQTDWDYPGVAGTFGWVPCECGRTDGTVDCAHKTTAEMVASAQEYLDEIADSDVSVEDPGYFSNEE